MATFINKKGLFKNQYTQQVAFKQYENQRDVKGIPEFNIPAQGGNVNRPTTITGTATFTATVVTGSSGIYKLVLSNSTTASITSGRYVYDVELILADSTIEKVHHGIITVHPEATKI